MLICREMQNLQIPMEIFVSHNMLQRFMIIIDKKLFKYTLKNNKWIIKKLEIYGRYLHFIKYKSGII